MLFRSVATAAAVLLSPSDSPPSTVPPPAAPRPPPPPTQAAASDTDRSPSDPPATKLPSLADGIRLQRTSLADGIFSFAESICYRRVSRLRASPPAAYLLKPPAVHKVWLNLSLMISIVPPSMFGSSYWCSFACVCALMAGD